MSGDRKSSSPGATPGSPVPRIITEAGRAVQVDVKPALKLVGQVILGDWLSQHGFTRSPPLVQGPPLDPPESYASRSALPSQQEAKPPIVLDAEIIEDDCATCHGTKRIRNQGRESPCPVCTCKTCNGCGRLGQPGHEVPCPVCSR